MTATRPHHGKLGIALAIFIVWAAITMGLDVMQAGGAISLDALVSQRIVIGLVIAPAFLIAAVAWLRWDGLGLAPPKPRRALLLLWLPLLYIALILASVALRGFPSAATIAFVFVNTLLVGISEELMFRGILFRGALSRMTRWKAIWLSCFLFGLVHALNVLITGDLAAALLQALAAFMSGVLFMALRIRTGSLYPLIIVHALWDFSLFVGLPASAATAVAPTLSPIAMAAPVLLVLPLFLYGLFLMRHVRRDFGEMSEVGGTQPQLA
jgi:membrane protease YdiL (CAAX protease family)